MAAKGSELAVSFDQEKAAARSLRVLIDARKLTHGGIGVYTDNLIAGLCSRPDVRVTAIAAPGAARSFDWHSEVEIIEDPSRPYSIDELVFLPRRLGTQRYDVFHTPHYVLPYGLGIPAVITVHDLIHIYHPERHYYTLAGGLLLRSALRRAAAVLTVSDATRLDIARFTRHDQRVIAKMHVVPNAVNPFFLTTPVSSDYLWNRFRLRGHYFLAVISQLKPHKGVTELLSAFGSLVKSLSPIFSTAGSDEPIKLILVGHGAAKIGEDPVLPGHIATTPGVHVLGAVSPEDLLHLYSGAVALVVPSRSEGFCLPALEAHAVGTSVVTRPVPAVMELTGESDVVCRDFSVAALAEGMGAALKRKESQTPSLVARNAIEDLARFDREHLASSVVSVYRRAARPGS